MTGYPQKLICYGLVYFGWLGMAIVTGNSHHWHFSLLYWSSLGCLAISILTLFDLILLWHKLSRQKELLQFKPPLPALEQIDKYFIVNHRGAIPTPFTTQDQDTMRALIDLQKLINKHPILNNRLKLYV